MLEPIYRQAFELARSRKTPFLILSTSRLEDSLSRFDRFRESLPFPVEAFYSFKTNYLPALCRKVTACGFGAEVTSELEWELARSVVPSSSIVVNGIGKQAGLLERVLENDPPRLVNLETGTEVDLLCNRRASTPPLRVGIRVHIPDVIGEQGADPTENLGREPSKFGWSAAGRRIIEVASKLSQTDSVILEALHFHLGGQLVSARIYRLALAWICELLRELVPRGVRVSTLDIGGGLASGFVEKRRSGPLFELAQALKAPIATEMQSLPDLDGIAEVFAEYAASLRELGVSRLIAEPGRFIAEPAMLAVATIVAIRRDDASSCAVLDIGTSALACLRSDESRNIVLDDERAGEASTTYNLVGPLCHRSDTFGRITASVDLQPGSLVCIDSIGAYAFADWIANTWSRPPVILEDGREVWRRQSSAEFWSGSVDFAS